MVLLSKRNAFIHLSLWILPLFLGRYSLSVILLPISELGIGENALPRGCSVFTVHLQLEQACGPERCFIAQTIKASFILGLLFLQRMVPVKLSSKL